MSKYNSKRKKYDGVVYRSELEIRVAKQLRSFKRKDKLPFTSSFECDTLHYTIEGDYVPDFKITKDNGEIVYIEAKGVLDRDTQRKMLAVKRAHPKVRICFLFERDNLIRRGAKMRYSGWCDKHGFEWAVGKVPQEWLI